MNEDKGKVHYQLSITGGQAGAFFLALLVALCLAFFFGMRTGASSRRVPDTVARLAAASDIPVTKAETGEAPDAAVSATKKKRPAPTEPPLGFDEPPAVKPPVRGEPASDEGAAATPAPKRAPEHPAAIPKPAPAATQPATAHAAAAGGGEWFVQVLATQKPQTADETAKKLKSAGYASDVSPVPEKPGLFRVRVGPFHDHTSAEAAAARVRKEKWLGSAKPLVIPGSR